MKKPKWTSQEETFLKENYQALSNVELALKIGRTPAGIERRLTLLKCVRGNWHIPIKEFCLDTPSVSESAYFAGHFDGEGCVTIRADNERFKLQITVQCCYLPVLELYKRFYGGSIRPSSCCTNKKMWKWNLCGYYAGLRFIDTILPYSLEKKEQLELTYSPS